MGSYVNAHIKDVTRILFRTILLLQLPLESKTVLASALEDGLFTIHDPYRPSEEALLLLVMNFGSPSVTWDSSAHITRDCMP